MTIDYDPATGTLRGTPPEVEGARRLLTEGDLSVGGALPSDDPILRAMAASLRTPMLTLEITNSGPGGHHRHLIDVGTNAVTVRWSSTGADLAELVGSPFQVLPGAITRLVGFLPGRPPVEGTAPVRVGAEQVTALASEDRAERAAAWPGVRDQLGSAIDPAEADASWQLVRAHSAWTGSDGAPEEDLAVYLRAGDTYAVLVQDGDRLDLVPVPSITAWEAMVRVLPGSGEIKDPRS